MADFVTNKNEFLKYKSKFTKLFTDGNFEINPFNEHFKYFVGFDFDFIFKESFFERLKEFLIRIKNRKVVFYTIDPSPEDYFYKHFKKYSVFEIDTKSIYQDLNEIMYKAPDNENFADSIGINSNDISWFSASNDWGIIGSRDSEIAIVGFTSESIMGLFMDSFGEESYMFTTIEEQVEIMRELIDFSSYAEIHYNNLIKNYQNRV